MDTHFWKATHTGTLNIKHETLSGDAVSVGKGGSGWEGTGRLYLVCSAQEGF